MTTDSAKPVAKAVFLAALDITDDTARAAYLDGACGSDAALRERVEKLLRAQGRSGAFLSEPLTETPSVLKNEVGAHVGYFGDYVLLDEIARGASGVVYRARQSSLGRIVALKMLRDQTPDADSVRRFHSEAKAAAALDHPNIVPIYEVGEHEGQNYLCMKFIEGGTLGQHVAEFQNDAGRAVKLIVKAARAVAAAHASGVLHRDIKPGNILLDSAGEPLVTDFGIARRIGQDSDLTQTGQVVGTPYYMSPEQARGETQSLTPQTDVYALGAVLYELLGGRRPFEGGGMIEVLRRVVDEPLEPLRTVNAALPRELETIVVRAMEKAPSARYETAAALADDLERWLRGEPIAARPVGVVLRFVKWVRRSPAKAALFFLCLALVGSWAAFASWMGARREQIVVAPAPQPPEEKTAPGFEPGGDFVRTEARKTVDILRLIDILNPKVLELWQKDSGALVGKQSPLRRLALSLPMHAAGDYDLRVEFTLADMQNINANPIPLLNVPVGTHSAQILLGSPTGCRCAACANKRNTPAAETPPGVAHPFGPMSGLRLLRDQPTALNGTGIFNHQLAAGPHTLDVRVRLQKDTASLVVELDGAPFIQWQGAPEELPVHFKDLPPETPKREFFFAVWNPANYNIRYTRMLLTPLNGDAWIRLPVVR